MLRVCVHAGGNTAVWGNVRGRRGRPGGSGQRVDGHNCQGGSGWGDHTHRGCRSRVDSSGLLSSWWVGQAKERCRAWGNGVPGARVEMPKCVSVLQARYEICVTCFGSSECLL